MDLLKPSFIEIVVLGILSLVVIIIGAYDQLANWFFLVPDVQNEVESAFSERFDEFLILVDEFSFTAIVVSGLIWSVIGAFAFAVLWVVINVLADLKNNLKVSASFVHPKSFHQSTFWGAYVYRLLFKSSIVILLVAGGALWITKFLPAMFTAIQLIVSDTQVLSRIIGIIAVWIIILASLHMFVVFLRLLLGRSRLRGPRLES